MSGIQLDWQVESEKVKERKEREDPILQKARRVRLLRLLFFITLIIATAAGAVWLLQRRVAQVDQQIEQALHSTVETEVAALRIGDDRLFMDLQRSATNEWLITQERTFQEYQTLKSTSDIQLTGNVLDTEIDGTRARVHVEEIIDGVPYTRVWFYWRYEDGWHHVPPDLQFWGASMILMHENFAIRYAAVDDPFAQQLNTKLTEWLLRSCGIIDCTNLPFMTIDVGNRVSEVAWVDNDQWQLVIPSPYADRARSDLPFDIEYQLQVATLLATRLVDNELGGIQPVYPSDAYFLRSAVISWLVGQYVQLDTGSNLITSLSINYGDEVVDQILGSILSTADMSLLAQILGVATIDQANLDWRDFITWRLETENALIQQRNEAAWLALYDLRDDASRQVAYARFNNGQILNQPSVVLTEIIPSPDGTQPTQLRAVVQVGEERREETILFNLVNNIWLRAG